MCLLSEMASDVEESARPFIDLRSDTVTQPTEAMREAMARSVVGDDVFGDDPTVRELEERAAFLLGKDAALFLPSGTMANLTALLAHTTPGQEVLLGRQSHIYRYEVGGLSRIAGLLPALFGDEDGMPDPDEVRRLLRPANIHFPPSALLCLENTHNLAGGVVLPPQRLAALADVARQAGLAVHLDGARLFNAAVALGVDARAWTGHVDSVMISLSKGLSAPVGSVLAGGREFIERARKARKLLGGGMRQAGVIAAAGIVALDTMVQRLADDHAVAAELARALSGIDGLSVDGERVQTNMVFVTLAQGEAPAFVARLAERGVLAVAMGPRQVRFVTHRHVSLEHVPYVAAAVQASL